MSIFFRHKFLSFLLILAIFLMGLRWAGESKFAVHPATPQVSAIAEGPLSQSTRTLLAKSPQHQSSLFVPLFDAHLALLSRMQLADKAVGTIDTQYYLFHDDESGRALLGSMIEAAQRGVQVRLLLDDMDTKDRDGLFLRLSQDVPNMHIRVFNPAMLRSFRIPEYAARFPRVTRRMHNKSFTADGITSIVGGRNIGDEYFHVQSDVEFADLDVLASGSTGQEVSKVFDSYWNSGIGFDMPVLNKPANDEAYQTWQANIKTDLDKYRAEIKQQKTPLAVELMVTNKLTPYYDKGLVISDPADKVVTSLFGSTENHLAPQIAKLMESAQKNILISSPYFIPGKKGMELFQSLRDRGVEITILTNSYKANDVSAVHAGYMDYRKDLLKMGVKLFELKPNSLEAKKEDSELGHSKSSLHAKSFVIDDEQIFVGSFNLDPRSALHNSEMGVVFKSEDYASKINQNLKQFLTQQTYQVLLSDDNNVLWNEQTQDGQMQQYSQEPNTQSWERGMLYIMSWLPIEWLM